MCLELSFWNIPCTSLKVRANTSRTLHGQPTTSFLVSDYWLTTHPACQPVLKTMTPLLFSVGTLCHGHPTTPFSVSGNWFNIQQGSACWALTQHTNLFWRRWHPCSFPWEQAECWSWSKVQLLSRTPHTDPSLAWYCTSTKWPLSALAWWLGELVSCAWQLRVFRTKPTCMMSK